MYRCGAEAPGPAAAPLVGGAGCPSLSESVRWTGRADLTAVPQFPMLSVCLPPSSGRIMKCHLKGLFSGCRGCLPELWEQMLSTLPPQLQHPPNQLSGSIAGQEPGPALGWQRDWRRRSVCLAITADARLALGPLGQLIDIVQAFLFQGCLHDLALPPRISQVVEGWSSCTFEL